MSSALYTGRVHHRRLAPKRHTLSMSMHMAFLDLDEVERESGRPLRLPGFVPVRFRREDYLRGSRGPLAEAARDAAERGLGRRPRGPVRLLTHLRHFGYAFNPLSLYYCYDEADASIDAIVAEVSNTPWNERHVYVLDGTGRHDATSAIEARHDKNFHVSPFMPMKQRYVWRVTPPGENLLVRIDSYEGDEKVFDATLSMKRVAGKATSTILRDPFVTFRVIGAIHWHALKLWLKGVPVHDHPGATSSSGAAAGGGK